MQVVIFAGGLGTRISEESMHKPKPLVEIGGFPIIWHIMKYYSTFGLKDFVILAGYKSEQIKRFFVDYTIKNSDVKIELASGNVQFLKKESEDWSVTILETGLHAMTGGRLLQAAPYLDNQFCLTYGDSISNIAIDELIKFHNSHSGMVTVSAVKPSSRFGALKVEGDLVTQFKEKPSDGDSWINGGFFVCDKSSIDVLSSSSDIWERAPMEHFSSSRNLYCFKHNGFWAPLDTLRDKHHLEDIWASGDIPWKIW